MKEFITSRRYLATRLHYLFCIVLSIIVLFPVYMGIIAGFKTNGQLFSDPIGFPKPFLLKNYWDILSGESGTFWKSFKNSVLVAGFTIIITLTVCVMAAFAIARIKFRAAKLFRMYFMLGIMFPLTVAMLPLYLQLRSLVLVDKYFGVILPQVAFQIPMTVLLLIGFFKGIPNDLEDACSIDGYGPVGFLLNMVIPLSTPILATTAIIILVGSWNSFFLPLLVFNSDKLYTLPMGVMAYQGQYASQWNLVLAYLTIAMIPAVALFIAFQKYIVAGLTGGAIKG